MGAAGAARRRRPPLPHLPLLLLLLLLVSPPPPQAVALYLPLREVATLLSLSHSLLSRVAAARTARGDAASAARASRLASHLSPGSRGAWSLAWDYLRHYAFSAATVSGFPGAVSRLLAAVSEASRLKTSAEAAQWLRRNYGGLYGDAAQLLDSLLGAFSKEGPLREVVMDLKWEVEEGELLKDCLEIGAKDLEGLLVIAKDLFFGSSASSSRDGEL